MLEPPPTQCRAKSSRILLSKQEGGTRLSSSPGTTAETFHVLASVDSSEQGTFLTQSRTQPSLQGRGGQAPFPEIAAAFGQRFAGFGKDKRLLQRQPLSSTASPKCEALQKFLLNPFSSHLFPASAQTQQAVGIGGNGVKEGGGKVNPRLIPARGDIPGWGRSLMKQNYFPKAALCWWRVQGSWPLSDFYPVPCCQKKLI